MYKIDNPEKQQPFKRIIFVIIAFVGCVYVTIRIFLWMVEEIMTQEPSVFIMMAIILLIVDVCCLVISIEEVQEYIKG